MSEKTLDYSFDEEPINKLDVPQFRKVIESNFRKFVNHWNETSLNYERDSAIKIIGQIKTLINEIIQEYPGKDYNTLLSYDLYVWKSPPKIMNGIEILQIVDQSKQTKKETYKTFSQNSIEYKVLLSGCYDSENDKKLVFRFWIPDFDTEEEIILLLCITTDEWVLTKELAFIFETFLHPIFSAISHARYYYDKSKFTARAYNKKQDSNLIKACEDLLYQEIWRICWEQQNESNDGNNEHLINNPINFIKWLESEPNPKGIKIDKEQDALVSAYISTILYLLQQGNSRFSIKIDKEHCTFYKNNVFLRLPHGPMVKIKKKAERSFCLVLQAIIQHQKLPTDDQNIIYDLLFELLKRKTKGNKFSQQARQLKTLLTIIRQKVTNSKERPDLTDILEKINHLSPYLATLINKALTKSDYEIELSSRWLEAWFGLRLLDSDPKILPNCDNLHLYEPQKIIEIIENWTLFYQYLIDYFILQQLVKKEDQDGFVDLPTEPETDKVKQAQLILLCEWAHEQGVPRSIPMQAWLMKTYQSELALYSLSPKGKHRQHIFHVQDTCLLGCVMLYSSWKPDGATYLSKLATEVKIDENRLLCNWLVAALLHDIGYTLQIIPRGLDSLPNGVIKGFDGLVNNINQMLSKQPENMDFDPTPNRTPFNLPISNHAYVSMITILSHMGTLNDQWRTAYLYEPALSAIIEHESMDTPVDYSVDPLSALLLICDQLQDWGRVRLNTTMFASTFISNIRLSPGEKPEPISLSGMISSSRLYIKIKELDNKCNIIHHNDTDTNSMQFLIHGPYANDGGYEPTIVWLDICRKLQKIREPSKNIASKLADETLCDVTNPKDDPETIESSNKNLPVFSIALQHGLKEKEKPELQRLIRFSNQDPEARGTILDFLSILRTKTEDCIQYGFNDDLVKEYHLNDKDIPKYEQYEWVKYTIPDLNNHDDRPIKNLPDGLYKSFRNFREKENLDS